MKIILLCLGFFSTSAILAQTTKKTIENPVAGIKEKYTVLKTNEQIKQGKYEAYWLFHNQLICAGFYKNNVKDSLWTFYDTNGKTIETGYYRDGKKTGIWEGLNYKGESSVKYDFTNNKLLFFNPSPRDTAKYSVINGKDTAKVKLDRPPVYLEGDGRLTIAIITSMRYPAKARESGIQGKVIVAFTVDQQGATSNFRIKKSIGYGCDEEAMKAVKHIEGDWLPGRLNGNPVMVEYEIPLSFTLASN